MSDLELEGRAFELKDATRALLLAPYFSSKEKEAVEKHLIELERLSDTYGLNTVKKIAVSLKKIEGATFLGKGKVEEIFSICGQEKIEVVVFDEEISPNQQRNLEKIWKIPVIDRTELILGVFAKRARTREAKLQIELAQVQYQLPRLKRLWTHLSRQRTGGAGGKASGSGGFLKGEGERQIEIDKRILKKKIADLEEELKQVKQHREVMRKKREKSKIPTFAIVGYTNVGKSTLLNTLTDANVFVEDKLFATLDTTTRRFILPNQQDILLIDTVGFIRKIPHTLVAAFRSTLEEAVQADILLHLIDVSSDSCKEDTQAALKVLKELKGDALPQILCLNKVDEIKDRSLISYFMINYGKAIAISAKTKEGLPDLQERMTQEISSMRKRIKLKVPQSHYEIVSLLIKESRIISLEYEDNDILIEAEMPASLERKVLNFKIGF